MMTYTTVAGDVLDDIVWQHYGRQGDAVAAVLAANPGLATLGPELPDGVEVALPELVSQPAAPDSVRLWQ